MRNIYEMVGGYSFETYKLNTDVISCKEAALAKNIPLKNELKTLILNTSKGKHALHLTGDSIASLRAVKQALNVKEAFLASKGELLTLGLQPGKVCPFLDVVWRLPHLISRDLFSLDYVSTNNGTKNNYIIFKPQLLLMVSTKNIGCFHLKETSYE